MIYETLSRASILCMIETTRGVKLTREDPDPERELERLGLQLSLYIIIRPNVINALTN